MRRRTLLTIVLIGLMLMIALLVLLVVIILRDRTKGGDELVTAEEVKVQKEAPIVDPFSGRELDAIRMVQDHTVLDPAYVEAVLEYNKRMAEEAAQAEANKGKKERRRAAPRRSDKADKTGAAEGEAAEGELVMPQPSMATIEQLVERGYLERKFKMSFLERGNWRSLQLETDAAGDIRTDPWYEVYLDYKDEDVVIGPVWAVNVDTGDVVARNDMAQFFEFTPENAEKSEELLSRPERVVKAITNHRFPSGIELGGVLLLHFVNRPEKLRGEKDRIIGWTVNHDFKNGYNAYFQWIEGNETRVARFRFNWKEQSLEPRGLVAIDLMVEGEQREKSEAEKQVNIWPTTYENKPEIPREARWVGKEHPCKQKANQDSCDAFAMVLEQTDFIESVQWLLTTEEGIADQFKACVERRECGWRPRPTGDDKESFEIKYTYVIGGRKKEIGFLVDPKNKTIVPDDDISRWAYWSVTPRT